MKTIGLVGGMSFESSLEYYKMINEGVRNNVGANNSAKIIMHSFNFQEIQDLAFQGQAGWDKIGVLISDIALKLERYGADCIALCANTAHKIAPQVEKNIKIPLIHIADSLAREITKSNLKKVGLLGTIFTMKEDFYKDTLKKKHKIDVIVPNEEDMQIVSKIIFDELIKGIFSEHSKKILQSIAHNLSKNGAEGIVLGCGELPLILKPKDFDMPLFDTTVLHVNDLINFAIRNEAEKTS